MDSCVLHLTRLEEHQTAQKGTRRRSGGSRSRVAQAGVGGGGKGQIPLLGTCHQLSPSTGGPPFLREAVRSSQTLGQACRGLHKLAPLFKSAQMSTTSAGVCAGAPFLPLPLRQGGEGGSEQPSKRGCLRTRVGCLPAHPPKPTCRCEQPEPGKARERLGISPPREVLPRRLLLRNHSGNHRLLQKERADWGEGGQTRNRANVSGGQAPTRENAHLGFCSWEPLATALHSWPDLFTMHLGEGGHPAPVTGWEESRVPRSLLPMPSLVTFMDLSQGLLGS